MAFKILDAEELYNKGEIDQDDMETDFAGKTIMQFQSEKEAYTFAERFVQGYLVPTYGIEQAAKFPMTKTGPLRNADEVMGELVKIKQPSSNQETWLLVPNDRYHEIKKYLDGPPSKK
jgi:hypothetical protein